MSSAAEDAFRQIIYQAATSTSGLSSPAEVLLGFLRQPFADLRCGAYRQTSISMLRSS